MEREGKGQGVEGEGREGEGSAPKYFGLEPFLVLNVFYRIFPRLAC